MQLSHVPSKIRHVFDDEQVISCAGVVPLMRLAERAGLSAFTAEHVTVSVPCGANTPKKVAAVVAGMATGADSIDDLDVLRHGGMERVFSGIRAPSTLGSWLRSLACGNVRQLEKVNRVMLERLAHLAPIVLPAADPEQENASPPFTVGRCAQTSVRRQAPERGLLIKDLRSQVMAVVRVDCPTFTGRVRPRA